MKERAIVRGILHAAPAAVFVAASVALIGDSTGSGLLWRALVHPIPAISFLALCVILMDVLMLAWKKASVKLFWTSLILEPFLGIGFWVVYHFGTIGHSDVFAPFWLGCAAPMIIVSGAVTALSVWRDLRAAGGAGAVAPWALALAIVVTLVPMLLLAYVAGGVLFNAF